MIKELLYSADSKVKEMLNIHNMVLDDFDEEENVIKYNIYYFENTKQTVFEKIKKILDDGLKNISSLKYEIIDDYDSSKMQGGKANEGNNHTFPYNIFDNIFQSITNLKKKENNLADKINNNHIRLKLDEYEKQMKYMEDFEKIENKKKEENKFKIVLELKR